MHLYVLCVLNTHIHTIHRHGNTETLSSSASEAEGGNYVASDSRTMITGLRKPHPSPRRYIITEGKIMASSVHSSGNLVPIYI